MLGQQGTTAAGEMITLLIVGSVIPPDSLQSFERIDRFTEPTISVACDTRPELESAAWFVASQEPWSAAGGRGVDDCRRGCHWNCRSLASKYVAACWNPIYDEPMALSEDLWINDHQHTTVDKLVPCGCVVLRL